MKKEDILIVIACKEESNGLYENAGYNVLYTGIGKINATYYLTKELINRKLQNKFPKYVVNLGSCGSKKFKKGEVVICNKFIQRDMDCSCDLYKLGETPQEKDFFIIEHKKITINLKEAICGTGDNFATKPCQIKEVDLCEMEGYALAKVCKLENIDFISIKYTTDGLNEDGSNDWNINIKSASESLFEYFKVLISSNFIA